MSSPPRRLVTAERSDDDVADASLRPQRLSEFIGQAKVCANLRVFIEAARGRREALDHVLFAGPPGLGKTTLAQIVARELGVNFRATSGPVIAKAGDLAALLTNLEERDDRLYAILSKTTRYRNILGGEIKKLRAGSAPEMIRPLVAQWDHLRREIKRLAQEL